MKSDIKLRRLNFSLGIFQLPMHEPVPEWVYQSPFFQLVRTTEECSLVCAMDYIPKDRKVEPIWKGIYVEGPLDFSLTGILQQIIAPLAEAAIPIFAISTYLTDYILVTEPNWEVAINTLQAAGLAFVD